MGEQLVIETPTGYMIRCKVCQWHEFPKKGRPGADWTFDGDVTKPTFSPSMNEHLNPSDSPHHNPELPSRRCHFIVKDGTISYCGDCSHELRGQKMPLEPWPAERVAYYAAVLAEEIRGPKRPGA